VFNRKKVQLLETELQDLRTAFVEFKADTEREIGVKEGKIEGLTAALIDVARLVGNSNVQANEIIAGTIADDLDDQALPPVEIKITIVDIKHVGVSKEVGEFSQSFSYALGEFLRQPNISSISPGTELYKDMDYLATRQALQRRDLTPKYTTYKRATTEILIHSPYVVALEEVTGAVLSFLEKTFETRKAQVQIREMSKEESPKISYRVQID